MSLRILATLAAFVLPTAVFAQSTLDGPYQVNYASNLEMGDATVNITNSGASAGSNVPVVNQNTYGDICANIYVYAPDQEQASCCSCVVSPNSLHSWPVSYGAGNLLSNVTNGTVLASINGSNHSVVIKLLATVSNGGALCDPSNPGGLANGMVAWATHSHPTNTSTVAITETQFVNTTLSAGELGKLTGDCGYNLTRGSQKVCPGCLTGGLSTALATSF